jgi:hypothetical protein
MSTLTITSESLNKLFGIRHKIENDLGMTLSYHTGMVFGTTRFFKEHVCWLEISNKGELSIDNRIEGLIKNKCAPEDGKAIVATIVSAKDRSRAVVVANNGDEAEMHFFKGEGRIATAKGRHNSVTVDFDHPDDLWIVLVLGWCALDYIFMRAWDKITYFDPDHSQPSPSKKSAIKHNNPVSE